MIGYPRRYENKLPKQKGDEDEAILLQKKLTKSEDEGEVSLMPPLPGSLSVYQKVGSQGLASMMGTSGHKSSRVEERRRPTDAYQRGGMRVLGQRGRHAFAGRNGTHWNRCLDNGSEDDASQLANNGYASHIGLQLPSRQGREINVHVCP